MENNITVQTFSPELFLHWIEYVDAMPKTIETYTKSIRRFARYVKENGINQPTRADIIAYRDELKATLKPATVKAYIIAVRLFFQWTHQEGLYPNIAEHIKGVKIDIQHKKDYLTSNQVKKLLGSIDRSTEKGKRDYAILVLMLTSGLHTIEVARANIEDMRALGDFTVLYIQGKGHDEKNEYVKIAEPVEDAIREYLTERKVFDTTSPLFASESNRNNGGRMTTRSISRIVKNALVNVGFNSDRLTAHSLRHTTATLNLLNGGTIEETRQLLRHTNINTTLIYSHALERAENNSEERVAKVIFND